MNFPTSTFSDPEIYQMYQFLFSDGQEPVELGIYEDNRQTGGHQATVEASPPEQGGSFFPFSGYPFQPARQELIATVSGASLTFTPDSSPSWSKAGDTPKDRTFEQLPTVVDSHLSSSNVTVEPCPASQQETKATKRQRERQSSKKTARKVQLTAEEQLEKLKKRQENNRLSAQLSRDRKKRLLETLTEEQEEFLKIAKQAKAQAKTYREKFPHTALQSFKTFIQGEEEKNSAAAHQKYLSYMIETLVSEASSRREQANSHISQLEERIKILEETNLKLRSQVPLSNFTSYHQNPPQSLY